MAKSKALIAAEARIAALELTNAELVTKVAALEAKVSVARTCYRALRDGMTAVTHAPVAAAPGARGNAMPVVTRWTDALGRVWIKTRIGSKSTSRLADAPVGAECDDGFDEALNEELANR